jgi:RNA ligase
MMEDDMHIHGAVKNFESSEHLLYQLRLYAAHGWVDETWNGNLVQFCYSRDTEAEEHWTDVTLVARGIIMDFESKKIVALPFEKFFNWGQRSWDVPDEPYVAWEKCDGSMAIIYFYNGEWRVNTKKSFDSEQAKKARELLYKQVDVNSLNREFTYVAEVIYPSNRVVVDYGSREALVLLSIFHTESGIEFRPAFVRDQANVLGFDCPRVHFEDINPNETLHRYMEEVKLWDYNQEGVVIQFASGFRVKIKSEEYLMIHRMKSYATPLSVWELVKEHGEIPAEVKEGLPDEFLKDILVYEKEFVEMFNAIVNRVYFVSEDTHLLSDKELGLMMQNSPEQQKFVFSLVFAHRKNKFNPNEQGKARDAIFRTFRPTNNKMIE